MAKRRSAGQRTAQRLQVAAVQAIAGGLALIALPFLMRSSPIGVAFKPVAPIGWSLLLGGVALFWWLVRVQRNAASPPLPKMDPSARSPGVARRATDSSPSAAVVGDAPPSPGRTAPQRPGPSRPTAWSAVVFDQIEWRRFEAVIEALFAQAGFETRSQTHGADGGVDIWLYSKNQPGAPVSVVQCKHWAGKQVGVDKVRELRGVMAEHDVKRGQFATTSTFTAQAVEFAQGNGIALLDVNGILRLIAKRTEAEQQALLAVATEGEYWRPTCASCGTKMVERTPRGGGKAFWGCVGFPKCRTTMQMRGA